MEKEVFLFSSGRWKGEGEIIIAPFPESISFRVEWEVICREESIQATQVVKMSDVKEAVVSYFTIYDIREGSFSLLLDSSYSGRVEGRGGHQEGVISWEFTGLSSFVGFERYEREAGGGYRFQAQYGPSDDFHTSIEGMIARL